jgi:hypothetical protein
MKRNAVAYFLVLLFGLAQLDEMWAPPALPAPEQAAPSTEEESVPAPLAQRGPARQRLVLPHESAAPNPAAPTPTPQTVDPAARPVQPFSSLYVFMALLR